jgi:hypothetical protein
MLHGGQSRYTNYPCRGEGRGPKSKNFSLTYLGNVIFIPIHDVNHLSLSLFALHLPLHSCPFDPTPWHEAILDDRCGYGVVGQPLRLPGDSPEC